MTWTLDPGVTHLNHGSFGATPIPVLAEQTRWRSLLEVNPVRFMLEQYQPALDRARSTLADFVGADPAGLVFVRNATEGVSAVLRSLQGRLGPGDEVVVTNHGYNACSNAARYVCQQAGSKLVQVDIPFPIERADQVIERIVEALTPSTRLALIDHISSPTGLVFPIAEIVAEIRRLAADVPVLVDAAHAPGMVPLDLDGLGATFVVGNCHKWLCAPKGVGFLTVASEFRDVVVAPTLSHSLNGGWPGSSSDFHAHFDWTGTDDPSARLSVPVAIETIGAIHADGWPGLMAANHDLVLQGREMLCEVLDIEPPAPADMIGSIAALPVPAAAGGDSIFDPLTTALRHEYRIEVPVFTWPAPPDRLLRISAQCYNTIADYEHLASALTQLLATG